MSTATIDIVSAEIQVNTSLKGTQETSSSEQVVGCFTTMHKTDIKNLILRIPFLNAFNIPFIILYRCCIFSWSEFVTVLIVCYNLFFTMHFSSYSGSLRYISYSKFLS